ncbi:site-specific DNA-methyltransferase [Pseudomonas aeruginosa]|nr:DNA methyltransferase [Pseudomonas aeruginosa]EKX2034852.1 DNA modification methylase [Pseudomonas aeruginosa]MCB5962007.1 site-specific DNA-methyltransferase [Pseudomonas aeruginosa]MDI2509531.1 site-specific DNA-methyltransferase [Pseudomonas aeruginosa]RPX07615.1 site-specific DNA-methyltransferase [Pseudomonas aeruginosa]RPX50052.1 site-specific DNA-methyltransferase [Pseudomonas aeruginosa]
MGRPRSHPKNSKWRGTNMPRSLAYERENALNAICPYFTMFPLEYPLGVLKAHEAQSPVIMDPFCGRGTTLFAARKLGLTARGIDSSPIAVAIARAKLAKVNIEAVLKLAETYIEEHSNIRTPETEFFQHAYSPTVLRAICSVRQGLLNTSNDTDDTSILRAAMLGCLHGPLNKSHDNLSYFSNQMPRTFAPKPDYSVRYWAAKNLNAPEVNLLEVLRKKLTRLAWNQYAKVGKISCVRHGDSRLAASLPSSSRDFSIVITSPPYYGMRTYVEDQWLRNWFVGGPDHVMYGNDSQLQHSGIDVFAKSLGQVWRNMGRTRADDLDMYIRFGIIPSRKVDAKALIQASLEESRVGWEIIRVRQAKTASSGKRQADHMATDSSAAVEYDFHVRRL